MIITGASAGLNLRYVGLFGRLVGSELRAAWIAACTSRAAASICRERSNCTVTRALPSEELDVSSVTPAIRPIARSRGVATVAAITSGLAPGSDADTETVGKSTCGSGDTGSRPNATAPASATPTDSSVVATGRLTNGSVMFTVGSYAGTQLWKRRWTQMVRRWTYCETGVSLRDWS